MILQEKTAFSQCQLWQFQREFFTQQGLYAWANQVPFYITSNPYIAYSYAQIIIRFMQDCFKQNASLAEPFYIMELGAGAGRFSFYLLKHLQALRKTLQLGQIRFKYIMTDFNEQLISYWEQHPALQSFIQEDVLDFAVCDVEQFETITLRRADQTIETSITSNRPLIVIANYIFDSIPHDVFYINDGQLREGMTTLKIPADALVDGKFNRLEDIDVDFDFNDQLVSNEYYQESAFNNLLNQYALQYKEACFTFPIASLRCIDRLRAFTHENLLLLATDKGYVHALESQLQHKPTVTFHGSLSIMVNFDVIGRYVKSQGGDYYLQKPRQHFAASAFLFGKTFLHLPETQQAIHSFFEYYSPGNLFTLYRFIRENKTESSLETLLTEFQVTHWDPHFFNACLEDILEHIPQSDHTTQQALRACLPRIAENYYHLPGGDNTLFNLGVVCQQLGNIPEALHYYQLSLNYFEATEHTNFNIGICYYALQQYREAIGFFERILEKNPAHITALGWLSYCVNYLKSKEYINANQ